MEKNMTFDYRIVKLKTNEYVISEVYYDDDNGSIVYYDEHPVECWGETLELLKDEIKYVNAAFEKNILVENEEGQLTENL